MLKRRMMTRLFLLTAPFDEEAKTGDGQYAFTLEKTFKELYPTINCTWLKCFDLTKNPSGYHIPHLQGCVSIPSNTIPSAIVLQPVANEKTAISGFQVLEDENTQAMDEALVVIQKTVSPKTPKIITDSTNLLRSIVIKTTVDKEPIKLTKETIDTIINSLKIKQYELSNMEQNFDGNKITKWSTAAKNLKTKYNNLNDMAKHQYNQLEYLESQLIPQQFQSRLQQTLNLFTNLQMSFEQPVTQHTLQTLQSLIDKLTNVKQQYPYNFTDGNLAYDIIDGQILYAGQENNNITQPMLNKAFGDVFYKKHSFPAQDGFEQAYQANKNDPTKSQLIDSILNSMPPDDKIYMDIHIRPPDCGVFINPEDIVQFQEHGITVNLTIHEYQQNYTRPHLQDYTHALMQKANTVLFFNHQDREGAISAGKQYNLAEKSGLTVAAQQLGSGNIGHIHDILEKPANILSFGTIRPGKGFIPALKLAQLIKKQYSTPALVPVQHFEMNCFPTVIVAGDPRDKDIMTALVNERFGEVNVLAYQQGVNEQNPKPYHNHFSNDEIRDYWAELINHLNSAIPGNELNNPFLEIHSFCTKEELSNLKNRCKYVLRMDDMGMRNNASAIISTLDVGIVYAKYGIVTDDDFAPNGKYGAAVDIGTLRYGIYNEAHPTYINKKKGHKKTDKKTNEINKDRLKDDCRTPDEILDSIRNREQDQQHFSANIERSLNYKTVQAAQQLLTEVFAPTNACNNLLTRLGLESYIHQAKPDAIPDANPIKHQQILSDRLRQMQQLVVQHNKDNTLTSYHAYQGRFFDTNEKQKTTSSLSNQTVDINSDLNLDVS